MKLSTGREPITLEFDNGAKETIYINPSDIQLIARLNAFKDETKRRLEEMGDIALNEDGTPQQEDFADKVKEANEIVCEEMDKAFLSDVSSVAFKYCSPFAIVNGEYFIFQFLTGIAPEISTRMKKAQKDLQTKMKKHTGKYE